MGYKGTTAHEVSASRNLVDNDKLNCQRFSGTETKSPRTCPFPQANLILCLNRRKWRSRLAMVWKVVTEGD